MKTLPDNITSIRFLNQQLTNSKFKTVKELTSWMGALQAQDYSMSKWAIGIRLQNSTEAAINKEINSGKIIRTHILRPTWHFVSSDDIYWILELTARRIKAAAKYREKQLGLTDSIFRKCNGIFEKTLRDSNHLTRKELITEIKKAKIDVGDNRASHIFLRAELDGIICSGKEKEGKPTYAILGEWVPQHKKTLREENLKELARRYFSSRSPASIYDFAWWSGLTVSDAKLALEFNKDYLTSRVIQNKTYWFADTYSEPKHDFNEIYLLPAYDELLISYRDRSAFLSLMGNNKAISINGIFYPTILQNGQVIGIWNCSTKNNQVIFKRTLFSTVTSDQENKISKSLTRYSGFIGRKIELF